MFQAATELCVSVCLPMRKVAGVLCSSVYYISICFYFSITQELSNINSRISHTYFWSSVHATFCHLSDPWSNWTQSWPTVDVGKLVSQFPYVRVAPVDHFQTSPSLTRPIQAFPPIFLQLQIPFHFYCSNEHHTKVRWNDIFFWIGGGFGQQAFRFCKRVLGHFRFFSIFCYKIPLSSCPYRPENCINATLPTCIACELDCSSPEMSRLLGSHH